MDSPARVLASLLGSTGALRFGSFVTKCGRASPYLVDFGRFHDGVSLDMLGEIYARVIRDNDPKCNSVHGLPYKGIPLATTTTIALSRLTVSPVHFSFFRKEPKDHGERGALVGRLPQAGDRVVVVDDVITTGVYLLDAIKVLQDFADVRVVGALVGVDRCERGLETEMLARDLVESMTGVPVWSVISIGELLATLPEQLSEASQTVQTYLAKYGAL